MVKLLLDTCVVSEITKLEGLPRVKAAVDEFDAADLFVSVITVGEIRKGVELLQHGAKRRLHEASLMGLVELFAPHVLPIDLAIADRWGALSAHLRLIGIQLPPTDGLIAATAIHHGLTVMTRNVKDFDPTGVLLMNPWSNDQ